MALDIERVFYYNNQYLTAADFTDEQNYLIDMRRRLHLALGHWGIAYGLDIAADTEGSTTTYAINPGVAIDPAGREIFVFTPVQLDDSVLMANLITSPGTYRLLLQYKLAPAGLTQTGNSANYTRWMETFQVLLRAKTWTEPAPRPKATDAISENAAQDGFAVPIATVAIAFDSSGSLVVAAQPTYENRKYVGTRTQHISAPMKPATTDITAAETPTSPPTSIEMHSSVYVHDNLIVGQNYALSLATGAPTPPPTGNLKIAGDLLLQGKIYSIDNSGKWQDLVSAIQSQVVPQIVTASTPVMIVIPPSNPTDIHTGSFNATAQAPSGVQPGTYSVTASSWIEGVVWRDKTTVDSVFSSGADAGIVQYGVTVAAVPNSQGAALTLTWNIKPVWNNTGLGIWVSAIDTLIVGYMVVFTPNPA